MDIKERFRASLEEGYKKYLTVHPRSTQKIVPMHRCLSEIISQKLGGEAAGFTIKSNGIGNNKEFPFEGKYFSKYVDIAVLHNNQPISGLGFKFITSNYKQNSNNYFEGMLGETANLKRADFLYGQILVFKHKMPYYSSDKKTFTKIEHINENNIAKYVKLHNDTASLLYHKPDILFLTFIETGDEAAFEEIVRAYAEGNPRQINKLEFHRRQVAHVNVQFIDVEQLSEEDFSEETLNFLKKVSDFEGFINAFVNLTMGKTYAR